MAINLIFNLSVASGDGLPGNSNSSKQVAGLSFPGTNLATSVAQTVGATTPTAPAPTTTLSVPGTVTPTVYTGGALAAGTYYYKVTALNAVGETTGSAEASATTAGINNAIALSWGAVTGASSYKIYRGTAAGAENVYFTSGTNSFSDVGATGITGSVPVANTTQVSAPGTVTPLGATTGGTLAAGTYYYKVTALNAAGETVGSPECSVTTTGSTSSVGLSWSAVTGATSYKIYRGTAAGSESVYYTSGTNSYSDTNASSTSGTVPVSNTTQVAAPGTVTPTPSAGGKLAAATYYYKVTALNAAGETTGSTEATATTTGSTSEIALGWSAIAGATSYKIYRGTTSGAENVYFTSATNAYTDTGVASGTPASVPTSNTTGSAGSMTAGVYNVKVTYVNAPQGESLASASTSVTVLASGSLQVPSPAACGSAAAYNVYITAAGGSAGTETKQNSTPITIGQAYSQTGTVASGSALPGSNSTLNFTPSLAVATVQALYLRNNSAVAGGQVLTATWTPQGGSSNKVLDLMPQAGLLFMEPSVGVGQGGITALSLAVSAPLATIDMSLAG